MTTPIPNIEDLTQEQLAAMTPDQLSLIAQGNGMADAAMRNAGRPQIGWNFPGVPVFMGTETISGPLAPGQGRARTPRYLTYEDAVMEPLSWSQREIREFVNSGVLHKVPGFNVNMGMPEIQSAWMRLVDQSILFSQARRTTPGSDGMENVSQTQWSPWDVLETYSNEPGSFGERREGDWVYDVATGERIRYVGPTSRTTTSRDIDLSSPEDVKALTTQWLRELLGRAPNDRELAQFRASIANLEQNNPTVTTTTQTLSPNLETGEVAVSDSQSTTSGGVSDAARGAVVQDSVIGTPEYGKFQGGTTFYNALLQMMATG